MAILNNVPHTFPFRLSLTQASNTIVPLGTDKCGSCDKELEEGTMQSFNISSHFHGSSDPLVDMNTATDVRSRMACIFDLCEMQHLTTSHLLSFP